MIRRSVLPIVLVALVYFVTGRLGLALTGDDVTPVWPPSGICLAILFLYGTRLWPGVLLGGFLTVWSTEQPVWIAVTIAIGMAAQAVVGVTILRFAGFESTLSRLRDVTLLVIVAVVCPMIGAMIGANTLLIADRIGEHRYAMTLAGWWLTGFVSMLVVAPLVFVGYARRRHLLEKGAGYSEATLLGITILVLGGLSMIHWGNGLNRLTRPSLMFLPLIWAAVRFGPFGAALASASIAGLSLVLIRLELHREVDMWAIQPYFAICSLTGLTLAALVASRRSAERYKASVLDAAIDAVVTIDSTGAIREVNHRAEQLFGYKADLVLGKSISDTMMPPDLRAAHRNALERYLRSGSSTVLGRRTRMPAMRSDGTEFPAEVSIVRVPQPGPALFTGFIRDITTEVQAEERMRRAQEDLERKVMLRTAELRLANAELTSRREQDAIAQQLAHVGSFELEINEQRVTWSDETFRIFGLDPGTYKPTYEDSFRRLHPDDRAFVENEVRRAISTLSTMSTEQRVVRPDGSIRYVLAHAKVVVDADGRAQRLVGSCQDVTEQRTAEFERDRLVRLVEFSDDAMIGIDPELRIEIWNPGAAKLYLRDAHDAIGQVATILVPPEDAAHLRDHLTAIMRGWHIEQHESVHVRSDGTRFDASVSSSAIRNTAGRIIGVAKVVRDITARTAMDAQIRASLEEKEVLLREIHHRVKNNLQIISSFLNLQISKLSSPDARRAATESQSRIQSMALVHQLLYQSKDLASIDFGDYLRALAQRLVTMYRPNDGVRVDVASNAQLDIDAAIPCGLIVNELVVNALTHAFPDDRPGHVTVSLCREDLHYVLEVIDDGVGIPEGLNIDRVASFGLKIARTLSHQLGGNLTITRDNGTTVRVEFPASTAAARSAA